jgi:hypothetical protein
LTCLSELVELFEDFSKIFNNIFQHFTSLCQRSSHGKDLMGNALIFFEVHFDTILPQELGIPHAVLRQHDSANLELNVSALIGLLGTACFPLRGAPHMAVIPISRKLRRVFGVLSLAGHDVHFRSWQLVDGDATSCTSL